MTQSHGMPRAFWGGAAALAPLAFFVLASPLGCKRRTEPRDWVSSAPAASVMAMSGQAGWLLEQPGLQSYIEKFPYADQTLDLFLKKARINPHQETGRITFYVMSFPGEAGTGGAGNPKPVPDFLIQLGGFKDQAAVHMAICDAFPSEGSLPLGKRELPVYVILDVNTYHFRAVADPQGRIWLGELRSLAKLDAGAIGPRNAVSSATEWINADAPFQGFMRPKAMLDDLGAGVPAELRKNVPQGIDALAWSVTPGVAGKEGLHRFELAIAGSAEGVLQVAPWVQRFAAVAISIQGAQGAQAPEILQERQRIGLRCQLTGEQINQALGKLSQPGISFPSRKP